MVDRHGTASSALLGDAIDNLIYAQELDCTLSRCLDSLHSQSGCTSGIQNLTSGPDGDLT